MAMFRTQRLAIDLGSYQTIIYIENRGIALREPSLVVVDPESDEVVAYGHQAAKFIGRTQDQYKLVAPIRNGVIYDFDLTKKMLAEFIQKALYRKGGRPQVVISTPSSMTPVERRALIDTMRDIGIHRAMIIDSALATALGLNLPMDEPEGNLVINIGEGSTEIALISYGEILAEDALPVAGHRINRTIQAYVRQHYNLIIGEETAEEIKIKIGNANYTDADKQDKIEITGRSVGSGTIGTAMISGRIISLAIEEVLYEIIESVKFLLEDMKPQLLGDISKNGIYLAGGTALLKRLPERLEQELKTIVHLAPNPTDCVALGSGVMLKDLQRESRRIQRH